MPHAPQAGPPPPLTVDYRVELLFIASHGAQKLGKRERARCAAPHEHARHSASVTPLRGGSEPICSDVMVVPTISSYENGGDALEGRGASRVRPLLHRVGQAARSNARAPRAPARRLIIGPARSRCTRPRSGHATGKGTGRECGPQLPHWSGRGAETAPIPVRALLALADAGAWPQPAQPGLASHSNSLHANLGLRRLIMHRRHVPTQCACHWPRRSVSLHRRREWQLDIADPLLALVQLAPSLQGKPVDTDAGSTRPGSSCTAAAEGRLLSSHLPAHNTRCEGHLTQLPGASWRCAELGILSTKGLVHHPPAVPKRRDYCPQ